MKLQPYPEYKDSGVPWLGEIPQHWQALPNRALFNEVNARNHPEEPLLSVTISKGVIRQTDLLANTSKKDSSNENKANYKLVQPCDIAYNKMRAWQGAIGVSNYRGIVSPAYIVVRLRGEQNPEYFHYLLRTPAFAKEAERWSYGITSDQWSLRAEDFKQIYCALPPKEEQNAIVRYLAHSDRLVNRLIYAKRRLIELLNEQKQAIIHRAVTRGLNPNVRLKPSGIAWLGDVPAHWEIVRLGRLVQLTTGFPFSSQGFSLHEGDTRLLRGINVSPGMIRWDSVVRWPSSQIDAFSSFALRVGDVVLGMDRPIVSSGIRIAVIQEQDIPSLLLQRVARLRPLEPLENSYMVLLVSGRGFSNYLAPVFTGISVPHISPEQIRSFRVALPPWEEQATIVMWIRSRTDAIERALNSARHEIDLLR